MMYICKKNKTYIMKPQLSGNYFEDFIVGDTINHYLSKTIFESDNNLFCLLTINVHPLHTNIDYAAQNQHGKILVVGLLVFSLAASFTVPDISANAIANLEYSEIKHLAPVFINDTIYARTKILSKRESKSKPDRGIVEVETVAYNQNNENVLSFKRKVLIKKKGL